MRTSLFLSTLFAVTLAGGAALAEKSHDAGQGKEPRVVQSLRAHGDIVDKAYGAGARGSHVTASTETVSHGPTSKPLLDRGASRISCSNTDVDCFKQHGSAHAAGLAAPAAQTNREVRPPAFLDKVLGSDRVSCNEADQCSMGNRAVKRAWEHGGAAHHGDSAREAAAGAHASTLSSQKQVSRYDEQYSSSRVVCNEGDQCMASSKETKKEWAYGAVKAGTWQGPEKQVSPAAVRIKEYRAAEGTASVSKADKQRVAPASPAQHEDAH